MVQGAGATLFYDPLDRLRFVQGGANIQLIYDGSELIAEHDYHGLALLRRYVHGPGTDEPLVWYEGSGTNDRRWLVADERGSIIGAFDDARGGLGYVAYDEDGRRQVWGNPGRFGFTGQQWLPEVGMYYFRARMYDPEGARFPQTDPVWPADGLNGYTYVGGDPINLVDPTGMWWASRIELKRSEGPGGGSVVTWGSSSGGSSGGGLVDADGNVRVAVSNNIYWERSDGSGGQWGGNVVASGGSFFLADSQLRLGKVHVLSWDDDQGPPHAVPGGPISEAQRRCRSCHGVGTTPDRRYTTDAENDALRDFATSLIPAAKITQIPWILGRGHTALQWANRMSRGNWTSRRIDEALRYGRRFSAPNNLNPGNPATRYVHPGTGQSVVVDNVTREVIHLGGPGFRY